MSKQKKIATKIQIAVLAFFIVFMPLGSWYYLQSGFNYNKELMSELKNYGRIPSFAMLTQNGDTLTDVDLRGKFTVANFYTDQDAAVSMTYAKSLLSQFKTQKDLYFLFHSLSPTIQNDSILKVVAEKEELLDKRAFLLSDDEGQLLRLMDTYKIPLLDERTESDSITFQSGGNNLPETYPYFVLIDTSLMIRNYYDIRDEASMNRFVEHLAVILPREKKSKAKLRPAKEK